MNSTSPPSPCVSRLFQREPAAAGCALQSHLLAGLLQQLPQPHHLPLLQPRVQAGLHSHPEMPVPPAQAPRLAGLQLPLIQHQLVGQLAQGLGGPQLQLPERQPADPAVLGQPQPQLPKQGPPVLPRGGDAVHLGRHHPDSLHAQPAPRQPRGLPAGGAERKPWGR